ncbi:MAG: tetratricopeptide repeat protein [Bacteroidales bacterium]|nr:tetratricopeptide repeat protein [Bacteroidales bacterium]
MKKILTLVWILMCTGTVFGQQTIDYILKAKAYTETGKPELAISLLTGAIAVTKESRLFTERAKANIVKGDYSGAISDYNEANKITPSSGEYGLSRIYALKGDAATALYHLEMNLNSSFRKSEKEIMLDPAFDPVENSSEWRQFWKKEWYSITERSISEIEYYISAGKIDESKVVLSELKKSYQSNDDILYAEALINLSSGKYAEVIKAISGLTALNPENENFLRILAKAQTGASNPAGASVTYTQILSLDIADADLLILRANCYRKTGETDKALTDIGKYLEIYPENRAAVSLAGKLEAESGDNLKALEYFSKNLKLHPNDPECYIDRANSYFVSKSWAWAIKDYSMSLDLKPGNSDIWLNKGIALLNSGRVDDACHDFRKSMSLGNRRASDYISRNCIK